MTLRSNLLKESINAYLFNKSIQNTNNQNIQNSEIFQLQQITSEYLLQENSYQPWSGNLADIQNSNSWQPQYQQQVSEDSISTTASMAQGVTRNQFVKLVKQVKQIREIVQDLSESVKKLTKKVDEQVNQIKVRLHKIEEKSEHSINIQNQSQIQIKPTFNFKSISGIENQNKVKSFTLIPNDKLKKMTKQTLTLLHQNWNQWKSYIKEVYYNAKLAKANAQQTLQIFYFTLFIFKMFKEGILTIPLNDQLSILSCVAIVLFQESGKKFDVNQILINKQLNSKVLNFYNKDYKLRQYNQENIYQWVWNQCYDFNIKIEAKTKHILKKFLIEILISDYSVFYQPKKFSKFVLAELLKQVQQDNYKNEYNQIIKITDEIHKCSQHYHKIRDILFMLLYKALGNQY